MSDTKSSRLYKLNAFCDEMVNICKIGFAFMWYSPGLIANAFKHPAPKNEPQSK